MGDDRADAAAQPTLLLQRHEGGAVGGQGRRCGIADRDLDRLAGADAAADRARGEVEQEAPALLRQAGGGGVLEGVGAIADDPVPGADLGVAGIAQVDGGARMSSVWAADQP
jgi:hypothetical protein